MTLTDDRLDTIEKNNLRKAYSDVDWLITALRTEREKSKRYEEALKPFASLSYCDFCLGSGEFEETPNFQNAYGEHGLEVSSCICQIAREALASGGGE